jgi:tRNA-splicing ligase RtcB
MERLAHRHRILLPDRELACAPLTYPEAEDYYQAMSTACNFAWTNRQIITHWVRQALQQIFQADPEDLDLHIVYDVAHNIAKKEEHTIDGKRIPVVVHRKGATRAFPPNHPKIPNAYKNIGQPVLIPGSMGTSSWVLVGTHKAMELSFGSTAHGAGRLMSRRAAKRQYWGGDIVKQLKAEGIIVRAMDPKTVAEEAPGAYKDVDAVVEVSHQVGIATKVARLVPLGVTKG